MKHVCKGDHNFLFQTNGFSFSYNKNKYNLQNGPHLQQEQQQQNIIALKWQLVSTCEANKQTNKQTK